MKIGTDGSLRSCRFSFVPARRPVGAGRLRRGADRLRPRRSGCTAAGGGLRFPGAGRWSCRGFSLRGALEGAWGGLLRSSVRGPAVFGGAVLRGSLVAWSCAGVVRQFFSRAVRRACLVAFGGVWAAVSARRCYGRYVVMFVGVRGSCFEREETWPGACCISS